MELYSMHSLLSGFSFFCFMLLAVRKASVVYCQFQMAAPPWPPTSHPFLSWLPRPVSRNCRGSRGNHGAEGGEAGHTGPCLGWHRLKPDPRSRRRPGQWRFWEAGPPAPHAASIPTTPASAGCSWSLGRGSRPGLWPARPLLYGHIQASGSGDR